ncbi:MAG TPA: endonuclease/exonuclease/phosphatase family protein [Bauldia sp.]|nr:endonuclease/exonuclease/phosphatase family protein [Bauldia sp.]
MTAIVSSLEVPPIGIRDALNAGPTSPDAFRAAFECMTCLDQIEQRPPPSPPAAPLDSARVLFWNAERLKFPAPSAAMIRRANPDAVILCELDLGMARSENRHAIADLAAALDAGYIYAVEFVELDLGDARERGWFAGERNAAGLHGAGLVSPRPLLDPYLLRLEASGRWFDGAFGERRVGGRIAVMASIEIGGAPVLLVSVHYESHTGPGDRLAQTRTLLDAIDRDFAGRPVLIGGDFNTNTMERADHEQPRAVRAALDADPERLIRPMRYEPMFAELARRGYDWEACNLMGAVTQRTRPDGTPQEPHGRIDWFFARGLACSEPAVIPAVDENGVAISDHEALAVTVRPLAS